MSSSKIIMGTGAQKGSASCDIPDPLAGTPGGAAALVEAGMRQDVTSWSAWPEIEAEISKDALFTISPRPFAIFNNIFCNTADELRIEELLHPFRVDDLPVLWWTFGPRQHRELDRRLKARGLIHGFESTMMFASLHEELPSTAGPHIQTFEVSDDLGLERWIRVMTRVFEFPKEAKRPWRDMLDACRYGPGAKHRHFIATWKDIDVGCASAFVQKKSLAISNVGVLPGKRRAGIGAAVTSAALRAAGRSGCSFATLLSTKAARSMYERLGFQACGQSDCYVWAPG